MSSRNRPLIHFSIAMTALLSLLCSPGLASAQASDPSQDDELTSELLNLEDSELLIDQSDPGLVGVRDPWYSGGWYCQVANFGNRTARCRKRNTGAGPEVAVNGAAEAYVEFQSYCEALMICGGGTGGIVCRGYRDCFARYWNNDPSTGVVNCDGAVVATCS